MAAETVSASTIINAPAGAIFAVLADPAQPNSLAHLAALVLARVVTECGRAPACSGGGLP